MLSAGRGPSRFLYGGILCTCQVTPVSVRKDLYKLDFKIDGTF